MSKTNDERKDPKILIPDIKIRARVQEMAQEISHDYRGKEITAICILKGSFIFFSDMIRNIDLSMTCEFLGLSSYGNKTTSSGEVKVTLDLNEPIAGKHVIIFEDIVDSGLSLQYIQQSLIARRPASVRTCALLFKPDNLQTEVSVDYTGFKIGKEFVVGYGMDFAGKYRELPYIGYLDNAH